MLPALIVVDISVFFFYFSKGLVKMKLLADLEILKNLKIINRKYSENQKIKNISDKEIINSFKNEVKVPEWVVNNEINLIFNNFLKIISKVTKNILL